MTINALLRSGVTRSASRLSIAAASLSAASLSLAAAALPAAQTTPPITIRPPSSAENPAPPPIPAPQVAPVTVDIRQPTIQQSVPLTRSAGSIAGPQPLPSAEQADALRSPRLPQPTDRPMELVDSNTDPILSTALNAAQPEEFRAVVQQAVKNHPALNESMGYAEEARYALHQQEAAKAPSAEIDIPGFKVLGRQFGGSSIDNIVERTRAEHRFDALASVTQLITDFGATQGRIDAAGGRLRAAAQGVDNAANQVALNTIAAWYDVYSLRAVLAITNTYRADGNKNRDAIRQRITAGASAQADAALVENAIAQLDIRAARYRQQLSSAEARFRELTGSPPPAGLLRAPELGTLPADLDSARAGAADTATTKAAKEQAFAAQRDARAARRDQLPVVTAALDAGRYGLIQSNRDYDIVARVTLRQRLFGGLPQRAKAGQAHAGAMNARAYRITEEDARDAATAYSDLEALDEQLVALQSSYVATKRTRDATVERFRSTRGTLFDVLNASDTFYAAAIGYVQALAQRDAARYVLLSRTGRLLDALEIPKYVARN